MKYRVWNKICNLNEVNIVALFIPIFTLEMVVLCTFGYISLEKARKEECLAMIEYVNTSNKQHSLSKADYIYYAKCKNEFKDKI